MGAFVDEPEGCRIDAATVKRGYLGYADVLLLHRLGGDPYNQETIRLWDSGIRLKPAGQTLYVGQVNTEVLVKRLKIFSYWRAMPKLKGSLEQLQNEAEGLQTRRADAGTLLIRDPQISVGS